MATEWTREQRQAIETRGHALLVSAAAGAGKTAVLTERILSRVCGDLPGTEPVDIDRLLVVTFTRAAAAEMRERISQKLEDRLAAQPDNVHLQRQTTLLHHAQICTIDSFCTYLLRNYFYEIGLDPAFRMADESELQLMKQELVEELLEAQYEEASDAFTAFAEYFAAGRNDSQLDGLILRVYEASQSHPYPEEWLQACLHVYEADDLQAFQKTEIGRMFTRQVQQTANGCMTLCEQAQTLLDAAPDGPASYMRALNAERAVVAILSETDDWQQWYEALQAKKTVRLTVKKGEAVTPAVREAEQCIGMIRDSLTEIKKGYLSRPPETMAAEVSVCRAPVETLVSLVRAFAARFAARKQEKNILDFGDVEHFALQLLRHADGTPSQTAVDLRAHFVEIMIDEYQDSNLLQEQILTAIAQEDGTNLFMVGDVKQSIYQFRQAHPELFTEKLESYAVLEDAAADAATEHAADQVAAGKVSAEKADADCVAAGRDAAAHSGKKESYSISLHKNFRSRREVLDSTNAVFAALMQKNVGGIAYDEAAKLYPGAAYGESDGFCTEVCAIDADTLTEKAGRTDVIAAEAQYVANRILELTDPQNGLSVESGGERHIAAYKDIVILLRSRGSWSETFVNTLMENGIPAYAESTTGFYETQEIQTVLQYLALLDNAKQDLPMAAALSSPIGGFSANALAKIRTAFPEQAFCDAVTAYAAYGTDGALRLRLQRFFAQLNAFRDRAPYTQIHELLWQIYEETGYYAFASSMPGGMLRRANLDMLIEQALAFEATSYKGLFHFLRYVEQIRKYDLDIGEASSLLESVNAVRIMTIHKSKGLEFPIVFLSGLAKQFNDESEKQAVIVHGTGGIGIDLVNMQLRTKCTSAVKHILQKQMHLENRAEEMRVLYVAMTRAREKLILTAAHKETETVVRTVLHPLLYQEMIKGKSMWSWLCKIVGTDQKLFACREMDAQQIYGENRTGQAADDAGEGQAALEPEGAERQSVGEQQAALEPESAEKQTAGGEGIRKDAQAFLARMRYVYPYSGTAHPAKISVSELKKRAVYEADDPEAAVCLYEEPVPVPLLPKFASPTKENVATEKGTAYHKVLECVDYHAQSDEAYVRMLLEKLVQNGQLHREVAQAVNPAQIAAFLQSPLGRRMKQAAIADQLHREQPFVFGVPAKELYPDAQDGEQILIQGIIDAYFEENGQLVLVDYKTDHVSREDGAKRLLARYHTQIDCYVRALTRLTALPVKEAYIYSFALEGTVSCI